MGRNTTRGYFFPFSSHNILLLLLTVFFVFVHTSASRSPPILLSDGGADMGSSYLRLPSSLFSSFHSTSDTCEQTYGFMPCTSTAIGNLFLILVYGYLMYLAATYLSGGSELLLEILGPGIIGGLFLPMLGALPDALLILVSGLSGSSTTAQAQVSVGMGLLAGSTVMLLTVIWGSCVLLGKCDLGDSGAIDGTDTKGFDLTGSGVSTDIWTSYAARIMVVSVLPFLVVQIPQALDSSSGRHIAVLIGLILSIFLLVSYCVYQIFQPWIQRRRIGFAKRKRIISGFLRHLKMHALGRLLDDSGKPDEQVLMRLFHAIDADGDGSLSPSELSAFVIGIQLDEMKYNVDDVVKKILSEFDSNPDSRISFEEFKHGIAKWLADISEGGGHHMDRENPDTLKYLSAVHDETRREHALLGDEEDDDDDDDDEEEGAESEAEVIEDPKNTAFKAMLMLIFGTVIAAIFADPLVDAVDNFSDATSIPSFFISFIILPLATNSSESVSAIIFASRKKRRTASLTFSELYGAATMNNVLCLSVFLALVYVRGLTWDFSSEVLVILIVCLVMGVLGSFRTVFPIWTTFIAFALYPLSLVLVYVLDYVFGWS